MAIGKNLSKFHGDRNLHILRVGFWDNLPRHCRSADRFGYRETTEVEDLSALTSTSYGTHINIAIRPSQSIDRCGLQVVCF